MMLFSGSIGGHVSYTSFAGSKPGIRVTLLGVAEFQVTFKDKGHKKSDPGLFIAENYSMGFKILDSNGISHQVTGIMGQFIVPDAYNTIETTTPNFIVFQ